MSARGRRGAVFVAALAAVLAVSGGWVLTADADQEQAFEHREHAGLFPLCTGCHEGIATGESALAYPSPELCANCHDGEELETVDWTGPHEEIDNLRFDHVVHGGALEGEDEALACTDCHTETGAPRMAVRGAEPARCLSCHEHEAESHYVDAACSTCHLPLAQTRFGRARIETLPQPEGHDDSDAFLLEVHGRQAAAGTESCATCHTRETCTSCHVDAGGREAIVALPEAPEGMRLPDYAARYPVPASHESESWIEAHGRSVGEAECSTCHTRQSCTSCHVAAETPALASLPDAGEAQAPGADIGRSAPRSHRSPFFELQHGTLAASEGAESCTTCHAPAQCTSCHDGEAVAEGGYHPANFLSRHATQAYGRSMECSSCHSTEAFCRDCHQQLGMETQGRLGPAFHDGQRLWFLRHGQAARQSLESCASCHQQRDCLQCHSTIGAFRINPHGPGFDPERAADRNREVCFACHRQDPLTGRNP